MEKLRNLTSRLPTFSYSPSAKLSKAFKFDSDHNVLRRTQTAPSGNPFSDEPAFEEVSFPLGSSERMLMIAAVLVESTYDHTPRHGAPSPRIE